MIEPIEQLLNTVGVPFIFDEGEIYGIPGFLVDTLYNGSYPTTAQEFIFQIATYDCAALDISVGDTFTLDDTTYTFTFKVKTQPQHDLSGFTNLICDFVKKELL